MNALIFKPMHALKPILASIISMSVFLFTACVEDDFDVPQGTITEPDIDTETEVFSIAAIAGQLAQVQDEDNQGSYETFDTVFTFEFDEGVERYISGYLVSSDEAGNFFEELILQDQPENPTTGIRVMIDVNPLFTKYEFGRKLFVKLNQLTLGISNGVLTLGVLAGASTIEKIPSALESEHILRSNEVATITPLVLNFDAFTDATTNLFVGLNNVQFNRNEAGILSYASEATDEFDGERTLEHCDNENTVICSTSTFADFKGVVLPSGTGTIAGLLTRDFFGETFNIVINTLEDVNLVGERCDPEFLDCTALGGGGNVTVFTEDFEAFSTFTDEGWTNVNINGGNTDWTQGNFDRNNYAQISGFNANENPIQAWLVSPAINMDSTTNEELTMTIQTNFNNGNILSIWVSTDFSGDPTTASWQLLDTTIPAGSSSGFGNFESIAPVNISCLDGDIYLGFFYQGADPGPTTRYHIDTIEITGN